LTSVILLILGAVQHSGYHAVAVEPQMDYGYVETLNAGGVELPAGMDIIASDPTSQPGWSSVIASQSDRIIPFIQFGESKKLLSPGLDSPTAPVPFLPDWDPSAFQTM
jgi:hypothetical protein